MWRSVYVWIAALCVGCSVVMPPLPAPPSADRPRLRLAVLTPMTGELATFGEMVRNGITLAVDEWNARGGTAGYAIQLSLEDSGCEADLARQAAQRVMAEGIRFIVGGMCNEDAVPTARLTEAEGALFVAVAATHPRVTVAERGVTRSLTFRTAYVYPAQGRAAARFALQQLGMRRAALWRDPGDPWTRELAEQFEAAFVEGGGQVSNLACSPQSASCAALLAEKVTNQTDLLYLPGGCAIADQMAQQARGQQIEALLMGSELWEDCLSDQAALEGAYFTTHFSLARPDPAAQQWAARYQATFALQPETLAALGYDATKLLLSAIQKVGTDDPQQVARALETIEFEGVTGRWKFDAEHNPLKDVVVLQLEPGGTRYVGTVSLRW